DHRATLDSGGVRAYICPRTDISGIRVCTPGVRRTEGREASSHGDPGRRALPPSSPADAAGSRGLRHGSRPTPPRTRMAVNGRTAQTILAAHSGAGLYATDRMFLESVLGLRESGGRVVVVLPSTGPLVTELVRAGAEVEIIEMLVVGDHLLRLREWPGTARRSLRGLLRSWRLINRVRPDVAYVSTATIPHWPLLARCRGLRSISHLHEVARSGNGRLDRLLYLPHLASQRMLVSDRFSLEALRRVLPALARRADVVHSGVAAPRHPAPPREPLESPLRL